MCRLLETIRVLDGTMMNILFHQKRFDAARKEYFGMTNELSLSELINIPEYFRSGLCRCRIEYGASDINISFGPYTYREISSLRLVTDNDLDYHLKYADRSRLEALFSRREGCDDIIIVKGGCLTDTFTANLVFFDGTKWYTPDTPLLEGTQRSRLLEQGCIYLARIGISNYRDFQAAGLVNAFYDLDNMPVIAISRIFG